MVRVLSDAAVDRVLSLPDLIPVVESAFRSQGDGAVERPDRPHFPVGVDSSGNGGGPVGTALTMPAYVHGAGTFATKLVTVHEDNPARGLPTVNAQLAVTDAETGEPLAYMDGQRITNARTACIGAIATTVPLESVAVYSPGTREACAADLDTELDVDVEPVASAAAAAAEHVYERAVDRDVGTTVEL